MSAHESWPSQAAHFAESLTAWAVGALVAGPLVGGPLAGVAFTVGKEGSDLYGRLLGDEEVTGDLFDLVVHTAGFILPTALHLLIS